MNLRLWLFLLVFIVSSSFISAENNLLIDLNQYFSFDNVSGATAFDQSGNGRSGTINTAIYSSGGIIGNAYYCANDASTCYFNNGFKIYESHETFTINVWAKFINGDLLGFPFGQGPAGAGYPAMRVSTNLQPFMRNNTNVITGSTVTGGAYHMITMVYNKSLNLGKIYRDGVNIENRSLNTLAWGVDNMFIGDYRAAGDFNSRIEGYVDEFGLWNTSLSSTQISELYNGGSGLNFSEFDAGAVVGNFTISSNLDNFSVIINGSSYDAYFNTTSASITAGILVNDTGLFNITAFADGYFTEQFINYNVSLNGSPLSITFLHAEGFHVDYGDFVTYNNSNYTRNLSIELHFDHCPSNNTAWLYINDVLEDTFTLNCFNTSNQYINTYYKHSSEGLFNISWLGNIITNLDNENFSINHSYFLSDLYNPYVNGSFSVPGGFVSSLSSNFSLYCFDNVTPLLLYNMSVNGNVLFVGNLSNNSTQINSTIVNTGLNNFSFACSDFFGVSSMSDSNTFFSASLVLIDEQDNTLFDVSNVSSARVYFDDNSSVHDFKSAGSAAINFSSISNDKLRFELVYADGTVITRWVDVSLNVLFGDIRVCANKEGVTHYEQLIIASSDTKPVIVQNIFSNCVIAMDYTRFAYQDTFVLKAFSIASLYSLFSFDDRNTQLFLASLDGSISSYINLDTLEFSQTPYNLNILGDGLSFKKSGTNEVTIYYDNLNADNTALNFSITRLDTNQIVFAQSSFIDYNEFTLLFDYSSLNNITDNTLFKINLDKTNGEGVSTIRRYFNTSASTGIITAVVAFMLSFSLVFVGLTFVITRTAFSWFGIILCIGGIAIAGLAVSTWYIIFLEVMEVLTLIYIFLVMLDQNTSQIA